MQRYRPALGEAVFRQMMCDISRVRRSVRGLVFDLRCAVAVELGHIVAVWNGCRDVKSGVVHRDLRRLLGVPDPVDAFTPRQGLVASRGEAVPHVAVGFVGRGDTCPPPHRGFCAMRAAVGGSARSWARLTVSPSGRS
jgi:hypothetical protein